MHSCSPKLLEDIRDVAAFVEQAKLRKTLKQYSADRRLRQAFGRNFEMIGEAIKRRAHADPPTAARIGKHRRIFVFRNVLTHGDVLVDHASVWSAVQPELPALLKDLASFRCVRPRRLTAHPQRIPASASTPVTAKSVNTPSMPSRM